MGVLASASASDQPLLYRSRHTTSTMADMMWGGVPFTIPSSTAMKYISGAVKVQREANLPIGGHYNARQTMERELLGHRQSRLDRVESYETYDRIRKTDEAKVELRDRVWLRRCHLAQKMNTRATVVAAGWVMA